MKVLQQQPLYKPGLICHPPPPPPSLLLWGVTYIIWYFILCKCKCNFFLKKVITNVEFIFIEKKLTFKISIISVLIFILHNLGCSWMFFKISPCIKITLSQEEINLPASVTLHRQWPKTNVNKPCVLLIFQISLQCCRSIHILEMGYGVCPLKLGWHGS